MIQLCFVGENRDRLEYVGQLAVGILGCQSRLVRSLADRSPGPVLTNASWPGGDIVSVSETSLLQFFDRLSLKTEFRTGRYDRHQRLAHSTFPPETDVLYKWVRELRGHPALALEIQHSNAQPTVLLSHDVDRVSNREAWALLGKFAFLAAAILHLDRDDVRRRWQSLAFAIGGTNTYWNFDDYVRMEAAYGFRSTFFFMTGSRKRRGARYDLKAVADVIRSLAAGGWEIGLHVNYHGFDDKQSILDQKMRLEEIAQCPILGARFHWLRFDPRTSFQNLIQAGFKYDSTLGFHDAIGYRTGFPAAYIPKDFEGRSLPIVEIPLAVMDIALFQYLGLSPDDAWRKVRETLENLKGTNATISILWHSNVLVDPAFEGWGNVYEQILRYLSENDFRVKTGREICADVLAQDKAALAPSDS